MLGDFHSVTAQKFKSSEIVNKYPNIEILIFAPSGMVGVDKELLDGLKKLKFISTLTVGTDLIDKKYAREKGILVSNAKGSNSQSVAEHVWGMILSLSKKITEADRDVRQKQQNSFSSYSGTEMQGKTIGIIGLGESGKRVARIAKGFNMTVIGMNKSGKQVKGAKLVTQNTLIKQSDVIAVCVPLDSSTKKMLSDKEFNMMKNGVILVNCAREGIVDQKAVEKALASKNLAGYGLDLEIMRKIDKNDPLLSFSNVILTPHIAFYTKESDSKTDNVCLDNIEAFLNEKPTNLVN